MPPPHGAKKKRRLCCPLLRFLHRSPRGDTASRGASRCLHSRHLR
jgi:hypothetical protein